ncbi:hypothetical protein L2E82_33116 [Cichorium intybus]|uniref:Uncharacterized protein n=1 Tax=Cichorium intybus TaxID=13427 RepID=A0ACB9BJA8_CICIN|nr:hypothetical protein L2E82_33116 [Cichorium intybus]
MVVVAIDGGRRWRWVDSVWSEGVGDQNGKKKFWVKDNEIPSIKSTWTQDNHQNTNCHPPRVLIFIQISKEFKCQMICNLNIKNLLRR